MQIDKLPRTLLIYPPITTCLSDSSASACIPLGLAYLAAVLEKNGFPVRILDTVTEGSIYQDNSKIRAGLTDDQIREYIEKFNPDIVGISAMFTAYANDAHRVALIVKKINKKILVLFGGTHASCNYDMVLKDKNIDYVVQGEGEQTLFEIVKAIEQNISLSGVPGLIYRNGNEIVFTKQRKYIENLDTIPFPARHLLDMNKHLKLESPYWMRKPLTVMVTSRGCPKRCIYCSIHSVWGDKWRARSAKNVVDEIELLIKEYGIREIHFNDDNIAVDKRRMHEICDEIIDRHLNIKWTTPNGIAVWTLDKALIKKMKTAGCYRLTFGIESGNQSIQRYIGKNLNLDYAKKVISWANKAGLWTISTHIIGFPCETAEQVSDTINFALKSKSDFSLFYTLTPFRGTQVYRIFESEHLVPQDTQNVNDFFIAELACDTKNLSKEKIRELQSFAYRKVMFNRFIKFIFNPFLVLKKIYSLEALFYSIKLFKTFISININLVKFKRMGAKVLYRGKK